MSEEVWHEEQEAVPARETQSCSGCWKQGSGTEVVGDCLVLDLISSSLFQWRNHCRAWLSEPLRLDGGASENLKRGQSILGGMECIRTVL